ncbi:hypothetical protein B7463_g9626, partial [Scytalidium lignicola]
MAAESRVSLQVNFSSVLNTGRWIILPGRVVGASPQLCPKQGRRFSGARTTAIGAVEVEAGRVFLADGVEGGHVPCAASGWLGEWAQVAREHPGHPPSFSQHPGPPTATQTSGHHTHLRRGFMLSYYSRIRVRFASPPDHALRSGQQMKPRLARDVLHSRATITLKCFGSYPVNK